MSDEPEKRQAQFISIGTAIEVGTDWLGLAVVGEVVGAGAPIFHDGTWVLRVSGLTYPLRPRAEDLFTIRDKDDVNLEKVWASGL